MTCYGCEIFQTMESETLCTVIKSVVVLVIDQNVLFQLLRKRHIGNDIVTIVFQEAGSEPFNPVHIRSHFQHIFVIVRVHNPCTRNTCYR